MLKSNASLLSGAPDSPVSIRSGHETNCPACLHRFHYRMCISPRYSKNHPGGSRSPKGRRRCAGFACSSVAIANEFLKSDFRKTLPAGRLTLSDTGIVFKTKDRDLPLDIRCCPAGDILIPFHMVAQERASGFVVGLVKPRQHRVIDNSLFLQTNGERLPDYAIAELILHELTHVITVWARSALPEASGIMPKRYFFSGIATTRWNACHFERPPSSKLSLWINFLADTPKLLVLNQLSRREMHGCELKLEIQR